MRLLDEYRITGNPTIYNRLHRRKHLSCSYCPPNRGENATSRNYKHPIKKEFQLDPKRRHR